MPSCVMRFCSNYTGKVTKSTITTYHAFPSEDARRRQWVNIVRKQRRQDDWKPTKTSKICSDHFKDCDKYKSGKGLQLLKKSAIPTLIDSSMNKQHKKLPTSKSRKLTDSDSSDSEESQNDKKEFIDVKVFSQPPSPTRDWNGQNKAGMHKGTQVDFDDIPKRNKYISVIDDQSEGDCKRLEDCTKLQVCRICLQTRCKLYSLHQNGVLETFEVLSGYPSNNDGLPQTVCVECLASLFRCHLLQNKSSRANRLLNELLMANELTISHIENIDRKLNKLISNIKCEYFEPNHYDAEIVYDGNVKLEVEPLKSESDDDEDGVDNNGFLDPILIPDTDNIEIKVDSIIKAELKDKQQYVKKESIKVLRKKKAIPKRKLIKIKKASTTADDNTPLIKLKKAAKANQKESEIDKKMAEYFTVTVFRTTEEKIAELQKRKDKSIYANAPMKCEYCYQGYLDSESYNLHMHKHTDKCGEYTCEICQCRCPTRGRLSQHVYLCHSRKFKCNVCQFESHNKYRAKLHMHFHEGKTYKCELCDKVFNHLVYLKNHLRAKHPTDNVCPYCGYSFIGERGLATHRSIAHRHDITEIPANGPYCAECKVRFASEAALQMHLKVSSRHGRTQENVKKRNYPLLHQAMRPDSVKTKKTTIRRRDGRLEKREIRLTKFEEPVPCEKCGVKISSARDYHHHFLRAHPHEKRIWYPTNSHPNLCDICGKMLKTYELKDHMLEHDEDVSFKCDVCGKKFGKKFNLTLHKRSHLGERYPCAVCGKLFNHRGNRDRHVKYTHTESKDFKCEFCGKCFKMDAARKFHLNHVHLRQPYPKRNRNREGQTDRRRLKETYMEPLSSRSEGSEMWE